jgi:Domain of unknown function (DUF4402)
MKIEKSRVSLNALSTCAMILTASLAAASSVNAATANITASVTIVPPVALTERSDMRFSGFVAGATPGTITLLVPPALPEVPPTSATPIISGGRLVAGGVKLVGGRTCSPRLDCGVGALQISGPPSDSFSVSSQTTTTLTTTTLTSGGNTMTLDGIELRYGANGTVGTTSGLGILNPAGTGTIVIGGVLNVAAGQAVGTYTGSLAVSVDY